MLVIYKKLERCAIGVAREVSMMRPEASDMWKTLLFRKPTYLPTYLF